MAIRMGAILAAFALFGAILAVSAVVPSASAHECSGDNPRYSCGDCKDHGTDPYHHHTYSDGKLYCESRPCDNLADFIAAEFAARQAQSTNDPAFTARAALAACALL